MVQERKTREEIEAHYLPRIIAARAADEQRRDGDWVDAPYRVCGLTLRCMSLADYLALIAAGNAHVSEASIPEADSQCRAFWAEHNAQFLWSLSPAFVPGDAKALENFVIKEVAPLSFKQVADEIEDYLRATFADRPKQIKGEKSDHVPPSIAASFAAFWVHDFAKEYGWTDAYTLRMPLTRLFQLRQMLRLDATLKSGKRPLPSSDEGDRLAAQAFAEIAALD